MGVPLRSWARTGTKWSAYEQFAPDKSIAAVADCGWRGRPGWARDLRVLPDGCVDLVWSGQRLAIVVPAATSLRIPIPGAGTTYGIRLRCGVGTSVIGFPISDLLSGPTPLVDLWGQPARQAEDELAAGRGLPVLEKLIRARLSAGHQPDHTIMAAAKALRSSGRIADVANGLSDRSLRRHFAAELGHGPKQLHRILRFQGFLRHLPKLAANRATLGVVAADLGYHDQSHLGRECRRLSGSSPAALVRAFGRNVPDQMVPGSPR